jgi:alkaline phosphatase D
VAAFGRPSKSGWRERRELYPQGVASGDPDDNSVLLWTRRPYADGRKSAKLLVEVAEDSAFTKVIATTSARVSAESDWTCRVLVGHLPPAGEYWYRFVDDKGNGSRIGRTLTAPSPDDPRPSRFAFVSCQDICLGHPQRLSAHDLGRRARRTGGTTRFRAAPGRLHLRSRGVPGPGQERP